jgi:uncharacterized caspase-like protein
VRRPDELEGAQAMTQWGLDVLFNPAKRHMDEEKQRLQSTREEVGDASDGKRIDLGTGKVVIRRKAKSESAEVAEPAAELAEATEATEATDATDDTEATDDTDEDEPAAQSE